MDCGAGGGAGGGVTTEHLKPKTSTRLLLPQGSSQRVPLTSLGQGGALEPTAPARQMQPPLEIEQLRVRLRGKLSTAVHSARGRFLSIHRVFLSHGGALTGRASKAWRCSLR